MSFVSCFRTLVVILVYLFFIYLCLFFFFSFFFFFFFFFFSLSLSLSLDKRGTSCSSTYELEKVAKITLTEQLLSWTKWLKLHFLNDVFTQPTSERNVPSSTYELKTAAKFTKYNYFPRAPRIVWVSGRRGAGRSGQLAHGHGPICAVAVLTTPSEATC